MKNKHSSKTKDTIEAYLMILPNYVIYFVFVLLPVVMTLYYSFTDYDLYERINFIGFQNYARLMKDRFFWISMKNTLIYSSFVIVVPLILGLIFADLLNGPLIARNVCRISLFIPNMVSMVSIAIIWMWIFDPSRGILNQLMKWVGLPQRRWLFDVKLALPSLIVMGIWKLIGYNMIIYLAGLQTIPRYLYESAEIDGASKLRQFFNITIPMLKPTTFFLFVISVIQSFNAFDQIKVMTDGGPMNSTTTVVHQAYQQGFTLYEMGYSAAITIFLILITLGLTLLNFKYGKQGTDVSL